GVVVFGAIEAADGDAARIGPCAVTAQNLLADPGADFLALLPRGLRLVLRRHLVGFEILQHLLEDGAILDGRRFVRVDPQIQVALFLFAVAAVAILGEDRLHARLERGPGLAGRHRSSAGQRCRSDGRTPQRQQAGNEAANNELSHDNQALLTRGTVVYLVFPLAETVPLLCGWNGQLARSGG